MKVLSRLALLFLGLSYSFVVLSQIDFDNYQPLSSVGELPLDFTNHTSDKVELAIEEQIEEEEKKSTKKKKADFILKANYMIDNLLMSGNVLFGDPVTEYVNEIADKILENEPELRKKLRFYCVKSNITNAFTTNQGMIFVTLGLLAQLENEAQLAFILGHEITHFKKNHLINSILEADRIFSLKNRTTRLSQDQSIIKLSNYSKKLELESDNTGFFYMLNAGYDLDEVLSTFDVLQFSHLPFDEIAINFKELENEEFKIPINSQLDTLIPIDFAVDEEDSKSTHPNLNKRRDEIFNLISDETKTNTGVKFMVSEKKFFDVRKIARFETIRIDLKNLNFVKAYYNAIVLLKDNPDNEYLTKAIAKAYYGIAKIKLKGKYRHIADDYED